MSQIYKVFVNNFFILFIDDRKKYNEHLYQNKKDSFQIIKSYLVLLHILEDADYVLEKNLICLSSQNDQIFNRFKSDFHFIIAAGGLVKNEKNKFLMIYKNNYWDLPKGKLDGQEIDKDAAFREVKEETNVSGLKIISDSFSTYHLYKMDSIIYLKETRWFLMETSSQSQLIPQIKEGIINVSWLSLKEIKKIKTYNSIHSVFDFFHYVLM